MYSKFLSAHLDKQERIINAAMKQFSLRGFAQASTNEMVKEAGISKGLLFHYFNSKKELFLFLYDYAMETVMTELNVKMYSEEKDLFVKWREIVLLKIDLLTKYPDLFNFLKKAYLEESAEVQKELGLRNKEMIANAYTQLLSDVDTSLFKEEIDVYRAMNVIIWTLEGFSNQIMERYKDLPLEQMNMEEIIQEMDRYFELLKQVFYQIKSK